MNSLLPIEIEVAKALVALAEPPLRAIHLAWGFLRRFPELKGLPATRVAQILLRDRQQVIAAEKVARA